MIQTSFIYFDIDDTLLDHLSAQYAALEEVYRESAILQQIDLATLQKAYKDVNNKLWHRYSLGEIDREYLEYHRFSDTMEQFGIDFAGNESIADMYIERYRKHWKWIPGARETLKRISEIYPVGFITNGFTETQYQKVEDFALNRFSSHVIISEEIGVLKPHPKVFEVAAERAGVKSTEILYVGDSYTSDIKGGMSAGWKTAWYNPNGAQNGEIKPDIMFREFPELEKVLF